MELLRVVFRHYRWPFLGALALSLVSAGLGVGVIAFINQRLIEAGSALSALPQFLGLLAAAGGHAGHAASAHLAWPLLRL